MANVCSLAWVLFGCLAVCCLPSDHTRYAQSVASKADKKEDQVVDVRSSDIFAEPPDNVQHFRNSRVGYYAKVILTQTVALR